MERSIYVWGASIDEILDSATSKLGLWKNARILYTLEGKMVSLEQWYNFSYTLASWSKSDMSLCLRLCICFGLFFLFLSFYSRFETKHPIQTSISEKFLAV